MANGGQGGIPSTSQQPVQNTANLRSQSDLRNQMLGLPLSQQPMQHPGMMQHPGIPGQPQAGKGPGQPQVMPTQQPGIPGQYPTAFVPSVNPMLNPTNPGIPLAPTGLGQLPPQGLASLPPAAGTYPSRTA